ncbi:MAG TPA: carbohydrate porin [Burkholderiales bacterium]|nr:carbohydrate porin [Burkholderiales bacterium]
MYKAWTAVWAMVALVAATPTLAQESSELARVREEMKELQRAYEARMQALEKRLTEAEARTLKAEQNASKVTTASSPAADASAGKSGSAGAAGGISGFNPAISLIMQGTYARMSQDPNKFAITGFVPSGGEVGPPKRSFGLAETELAFSANIDPYFRGLVIAALTPENQVEVEEAYFQTLALPGGLTLKGGRFLSGIGYQNEIHQHAWDFQEAPLAYKAFLGGRYRQDGVQLRWVAPTPLFLELGGELANGASFPGSDQNKNGAGSAALFAHAGGDIGASYAWRTGVSYLRTSARDRAYDDVDATGAGITNRFSGRSRVWIVDGVLKWAPNGNSARTNLKLQAEYFRANQDGNLTFDQGGAALTDYLRTAQSGWYAQAAWQFMPRWRVGYRYDALRRGTVDIGVLATGLGPTAADFPVLAPHNPTRSTAMLEFNPSEFSRLRLQLASDRSRVGATDNQIILQYIHSLGAHGGHRF